MLKGLVGISAALLPGLDVKVGDIRPGSESGGGDGNGGISDSIGRNATAVPAAASGGGRYYDEFKVGPIVFMVIAVGVVVTHLILLKLWHPTCSVTFVSRARIGLLVVALYGQVRACTRAPSIVLAVGCVAEVLARRHALKDGLT